jgi:uncharacterized protein (TIGR00725 family)
MVTVRATLATFTVGVMGSGVDEHDTLARPIGELIAALGANLLFGGGAGVMTAVSRAYVGSARSTGICIGIIPCASETERGIPKPRYPNRFIELPIFTHLPLSGEDGASDLSRNHINVLSSNVVVALPGGSGTESEIALAQRYSKPVTRFGYGDRIDEVRAFLVAHGAGRL